jgi:hypothetical protein
MTTYMDKNLTAGVSHTDYTVRIECSVRGLKVEQIASLEVLINKNTFFDDVEVKFDRGHCDVGRIVGEYFGESYYAHEKINFFEEHIEAVLAALNADLERT